MRRHALFVAACITSACGYREVPPPAAPAPVVPQIPEGPEGPPPEGMGRLLIDTDGEPAKVSRVTERFDPPVGYPMVATPNAKNAAAVPVYGVKTELLCITPCAVDARIGAETLVFTSMRDASKTSTTDVAVPRGTTVVRHRLGTETPYSGGYFGGALLALMGGGLTLMGGLAFAIGAAGMPAVDKNGNRTDPKAIETAGAVIGTVGLATLIGGIMLLTSNRPVKQEGTTTTFRVPTASPGPVEPGSSPAASVR